jgi:hypothetical protein
LGLKKGQVMNQEHKQENARKRAVKGWQQNEGSHRPKNPQKG